MTGPPALPGTLWDALGPSPARLAPDVRLVSRTVRGRRECVVRNETSGAHVRVDAALARLLARLDGRASVAAHLEGLGADAPRDAEAREALASALATLERAGIVVTGLPGAAERAWRAHLERRRARRRQGGNPLALRVPLVDPDAALGRSLAALRHVPARAWRWAAALVLASAALSAIVRAEEIRQAFSALATTPGRWWSLAATWLVLKCVHEAAHGLAVRARGGRVHEAGLALLVLMPVPYVDASDASLFASRRARAFVGAAGVLAELTVAALALLAWAALEPGATRELAFAVAATGSVSALLFNANPLLRFDGYHVLADLLGMPNLGPRANAWWRELARRRLFGLRGDVGPGARARVPESDFERRTLAIYGALAWAWRHVVAFGIALWLLATVPIAGAVLAGFALWPLVVRPVLRCVRWLATAEELAARRGKASATAVAALALPGLAVALVPLPSSTRVEGVVATRTPAELPAPEGGELIWAAGIAAAAVGADGRSAEVPAGAPLARIDAPALALERARELALGDALAARRAAAWRADPVEARALAAELATSRSRAARLAARLDALEVRAPRAGRFVPAIATAPPGARVARGAVLGHLVDGGPLTVRAAVRERDVGRLDAGVRAARVRLAEAPGTILEAGAPRATPAAERTLPSVSLAGGGTAVAPVDDRLETLEPVFHIELDLPPSARATGVGGRAYVALVHEPESLGRRWVRTLRQLLLDRLGP